MESISNIEFLIKIIKFAAMNEKFEYTQWAVTIIKKFQKFLNPFKKILKIKALYMYLYII